MDNEKQVNREGRVVAISSRIPFVHAGYRDHFPECHLVYPDCHPSNQLQQLWTWVSASEEASLSVGDSRSAREPGREAAGPAVRSSPADTGFPVSLPREPHWENEGDRRGQADMGNLL